MMIITQSRRSLRFLLPRSIPFTPAFGDSKNEKEFDEEEEFEVVGTDLLCAEKHCANKLAFAVPKLVQRTTARQPPSGVHAGSPGPDCRTLVLPSSVDVETSICPPMA